MRVRNLIRPRDVVLLVAGLLVGFGAQSALQHYTHPSATFIQADAALREKGSYKYVSPLLTCATYENTDLNASSPLKSDITKLINARIKDGSATDIAVYFRGFNGQWVGVNENDTFAPASLLKVPLMIAYFKEAQQHPEVLNKILYYDGSWDNNAAETFKSSFDIKPGGYKVDDLIKAMVVNSDNNATALLSSDIDQQILSSVYTDLGLTVPPSNKPEVALISAKQYSYFFRVLYNSTYLNPQYSEKALELLAAPDFTEGLEASVPAEVGVANKFGERTLLKPNGEVINRELHDCGLIYATNRPYLLCIMTRGKDFSELVDVIQSIGKLVYKESEKASN